jgi:hypothetical protein
MDYDTGGVYHLLQRISAQHFDSIEDHLCEMSRINIHFFRVVKPRKNALTLCIQNLVDGIENQFARVAVEGFLQCFRLEQSIDARQAAQNILRRMAHLVALLL